ncbi:MAG TPA: phenylalanine--tRNA ligase subunit beta [Acidimicrobiales bacterium]|nr:phenylalanine--tRNA ligase subunit beta [Acidimicrobiales bacterium]
MKIPRSWLREHVPEDLALAELVALLGELGTPVESVREVGEGLDGVVVARVADIGAIKGADKIRVVQVDAGGDDLVQVVCGAWNFEVGDLVPLATVGTVLPGEFAIGRRKMKGVESHGMLCAPDELGLEGDHSGILVLPTGLEPGVPFAEAMGITRDVVLELEVNANRPDAMSVVGVARDLAARLGLPFSLPEAKVPDPVGERRPTIVNEASDVCGRFVGQVLGGVAVGPSPAWIASRLALAGMRPINNVVDASNYVMLELGIPNHTYDLARLPGGGLRVRHARDGEVLVTLDDVERRLTAEDVVIADGEDTPVGIAGVMGGASSEIGDDTTEVLLEAAWWKPIAIARTSKRLNLRSEASARFEKGTDWTMIDLAVRRFAQLLGAVPAGPAVDVGGQLPDRAPVRLRVDRVNDLLGTSLAREAIAAYLDPIGFAATPDGDDLAVALPPWRLDSATEIDVIEEVARMHGYHAIERTVPRSPNAGGLTPYQRDRRLVRQILAGEGLLESWTTTFLSGAQIERCHLDLGDTVTVTNPLVAGEDRLRPSLLPGLLASIAYNESHRQPGAALFEIGKTFRRPVAGMTLPDEREAVAVAVAGGDAGDAVTAWHGLVEGLFVADARLEAATAPGMHATRTARVVVDDVGIGFLGEVDPGVLAAAGISERVAWLELDLERLLSSNHGADQYRPISRYPSSDIDLAFEVDDAVPAGDVLRTLRRGSDLVVDAQLFDVYRGGQVAAGSRSLAYTVRLQADDRTLTDDEVAAARAALIAAVEGSHGAMLRG